MRTRFRLSMIILLLWSFVGYAQQKTVEGSVTDASGHPLGHVLILINDAAHSPIAYTTSGDKGAFAFTLPEGKEAVEVSFRLLGWSLVTIPMEKWHNGMVVSLKEEDIELKEVKVTARKIDKKGDTLIYLASAFTQKQDRKLADILAKMPGIEVRTDGTIKYQGKNINKFYIEGMDLLGGKYALASNNLDARKVKKVEVYKNHQPIRALKNIKFSDQAALNIVLKDNAKDIWQGVIDLGLGAKIQEGINHRRDARGMVMYFAPHMQSISMLKTNNIGDDARFDIRELATADKPLPKEAGMISEIDVISRGVERKRYWMNDSYLGTTNWLFRTKNGNDLRFQFHGYIDKSIVNQNRQTTYLRIPNKQTITEDIAVQNRVGEGKGEMKYEINKDHLYLKTVLRGYTDLSRSTGVSYLNGEKINPDITSRKQWAEHDLKLIRRSTNGNKWSLVSQMAYNHLPSELLLVTGDTQHLGLRTFDWNAHTTFGHRLWRLYINYQVGITNKSQSIRRTVGHNPSASQSYTAWREYIEPSITYQVGEFRLNTTLTGSLLHRRLGEQSQYSALWDPHLSASYKLTPKISLSGHISQNNQFSDLTESTSLPIYVDYNTLLTGSGSLEHMTTRSIGGRIAYDNPAKSIFMNTSFSYFQNHNNVIYQSNIDGLIYSMAATDLRENNDGYQISGRLSHSLGWSLLTLSLSGNYSHHNYHLLIGSDLLPYTSDTGNLHFEAYYHPLPQLSFEWDSSLNHLSVGAKEQDQKRRVDAYLHELKVFYMPGDWTIKWENSLYHSSDKSVSLNYFSDLSISYRTDRYEAGIECRNIFGTTDYTRHWITNTTHRASTTHLRGREIMIRYSFSL